MVSSATLPKRSAFGSSSHSATLPGTLDDVKALVGHPAFQIRNPNKVRALLGMFAHGNQVRFHAANGEGYRFIAEQVALLDELNPQVAARLASAFNRWRRFDPPRQALMREQLLALMDRPKLSSDVFEIVSKSLQS